MKNFYISIWFLLAAASLITVLSGSFNPLSLLALSLIALALVLSLTMWSVITQRDLKTD